jgi:hypothetical protein
MANIALSMPNPSKREMSITAPVANELFQDFKM